MICYRVYAVRDRLLDYFGKPVFAQSDKEVLASAAHIVNNPESDDALAHTPQHFEIWRLGEIDEKTGQIGGDRELLADAASLVRPGIRAERESGASALARSDGRSGGQAPTPAPGASAVQHAPQGAPQAENQPGKGQHPGPR